MRAAIRYHLAAAKALLESEAIDRTVYTDRRENLLRWNKGVRVYIRELTGSSNSGEFEDLEYARMLLSDPATTLSETPELQKLQQTSDLYDAGQFGDCLQACTSIINDSSSSLFAEAAARIIAAALKDVRLNVNQRAEDLYSGYIKLRSIVWLPGAPKECPGAWKATVDVYLEACGELFPLSGKEVAARQAAA